MTFINRDLQQRAAAYRRVIRWRKLHPIRWKRHQTRYRMKKRRPCLFCKKKMPFPSTGRKRHKKCQRAVTLQKSKTRHQIAQTAFSKYKVAKGCKRCGYRKCAAALDFHHLDPSIKETRITAKWWVSHSSKLRAELEKCVLLCKNCHYEEHHGNEDKKISENGDVYK